MSDIIEILIESELVLIEILEPPSEQIELFNQEVIQIVVPGTFTKVLSGLSDSIDEIEHGLSVVRGIRVCDPDGNLTEVKETYIGTTVDIESTLPLDGYTITIY